MNPNFKKSELLPVIVQHFTNKKVLKKSVKFECDTCFKVYSTRQGLWYHRNKNIMCLKKKDVSVTEKNVLENLELKNFNPTLLPNLPSRS